MRTQNEERLASYMFCVLPDRKGGRVTTSHLGAQIGSLVWTAGYERNDPPIVTGVDVDPDHRHKGLPTEMYRQASQHTGQLLSHSVYRTDAADRWASQVGGYRPDRIKVEDY